MSLTKGAGRPEGGRFVWKMEVDKLAAVMVLEKEEEEEDAHTIVTYHCSLVFMIHVLESYSKLCKICLTK